MIRFGFRLSLAIVLVACSPDDRGRLEPISGPDVTLVSTHGIPEDTARLSVGGVVADVTGLWSNQNESVDIVYKATASAVVVPISSASTWNAAAAPATQAEDVTERKKGDLHGRKVLGGDLRLMPGESRTVEIIYDRPGEGARPRYGDEVTITVPMPGRAVPIRFRLAGE